MSTLAAAVVASFEVRETEKIKPEERLRVGDGKSASSKAPDA
jgi:hypothetical protein